MVTPLASRFAVLPVDDDGDTSRKITAKSLKKKDDPAKSMSNKTNSAKKPDVKKKPNSNKKSDQSTSNKQKSKSKDEAKNKNPTDEQWEQWKQKDAEFVDGHYEEELHQAMLLSKLDYEEKKEYYEQIRKASVEEKKPGTKKNKKSQKAQPMSLSQFNQLGENDSQVDVNGGGDTNAGLPNGNNEPDPEFFDRVKCEATKAFQTEQVKELMKAREPHIDEMISVAQYEDRLQKCREEIEKLKQDNTSLQEELLQVKKRNKKLCQLLLQGEMKDKAQVLVEVDKLQKVREELTNEVCSLAAQLEQEKSKVHALTTGDARAKEKLLKKNVRFNAASESGRGK